MSGLKHCIKELPELERIWLETDLHLHLRNKETQMKILKSRMEILNYVFRDFIDTSHPEEYKTMNKEELDILQTRLPERIIIEEITTSTRKLSSDIKDKLSQDEISKHLESFELLQKRATAIEQKIISWVRYSRVKFSRI